MSKNTAADYSTMKATDVNPSRVITNQVDLAKDLVLEAIDKAERISGKLKARPQECSAQEMDAPNDVHGILELTLSLLDGLNGTLRMTLDDLG